MKVIRKNKILNIENFNIVYLDKIHNFHMVR